MNWNPEMEYFELLKLTREPFSNSPDPELFYATPTFLQALQKLEIAIRLRRGLNLVLGDVGTGKTTMSRVLLRAFESEQERFSVHLMLDPGFPSDEEMLAYLIRLLGGEPPSKGSRVSLMDGLQHILLRETLEKDRVVVLFIDEGQKLSPSGLETLRELLNFESNQWKLLQVVVFAQVELWDRLRRMPNLLDRVNLIVRLQALSLHETRAMLHHRLTQSGMDPQKQLFTPRAVRLIQKLSAGHPRKIINLCHHSLLRAITTQAQQVDLDSVKWAYAQIREILTGEEKEQSPRKRSARAAALGAIAAAGLVGLAVMWLPARLSPPENPLLEFQEKTPQPESKEQEAREAQAQASTSAGEPRVSQDLALGQNTAPVKQLLALSPEEWLGKLGESGRLDSGVRVVVRKGDTLSALVERNLGMVLDTDSEWMRRFKRANPGLINPDRLQPGDSLILPLQKEPAKELEAEPLAWFPSRERAEAWARQELERLGEGTLFLAPQQRDGSGGYGVFRVAVEGETHMQGFARSRIGAGEMLQVFTIRVQPTRVEP